MTTAEIILYYSMGRRPNA